MPARLPCFRFAAPRSSRLRIATLAALGIALAASPGVAGEVMVVGSPHLSALRPEPGPERLREVVERLASWAPTVVCVEAIPGERVRQLAGDPETWGDLLSVFALDAIRLAPEQQAVEIIRRLGLAPHARPFSRCLECNAALQEVVSPAAAEQRVPPAVRARHTRFSACPGCGRVYWEGSHWARMRARIDALLAHAHASPGDEAAD